MGGHNLFYDAETVFHPETVFFTSLGGVAHRFINKTGGVSVKGTVVTVGSANDSVIKVPVNVPNAIGVIFNSGIADGDYVWVVTSGKAEVLFIGSTTVGYLARTFLTADAGAEDGKALSEAIPSPPFSSDKHFCEIGHVVEARTGAGLALVNLHFN